jgi:hypothetical protein
MRIPTRSEQAKVFGPPAFERWLVILLMLSPAILEAIYRPIIFATEKYKVEENSASV